MKFRKGLCVLAATAVAAIGTGCGGISASPSVSPGSFFLPGLMKNEAPKQAPASTVPAAPAPAVASSAAGLPNS